jgi:hypothetical protein
MLRDAAESASGTLAGAKRSPLRRIWITLRHDVVVQQDRLRSAQSLKAKGRSLTLPDLNRPGGFMRIFLKVASASAASVAVAAGAFGVVSAMAASPAQGQTRGRIAILVVAHGSGKSYDVLTGAIADYGTDHDAGHNMQKIVLSKGTFDLAAGQFNKNFKIKTDKATCAVTATSHGANLPLSHGTGAYAGITGSVSIKATFAELAQKSPSGKCELNKTPISASDVITGSGTVAYGPKAAG